MTNFVSPLLASLSANEPLSWGATVNPVTVNWKVKEAGAFESLTALGGWAEGPDELFLDAA